MTIVSLTLLSQFALGVDPSFGFCQRLERHLWRHVLPEEVSPLLSCLSFAVVLWLTKMLFMRYSLKFLFLYKGWIYDARRRGGHVSHVLISGLTIVSPFRPLSCNESVGRFDKIIDSNEESNAVLISSFSPTTPSPVSSQNY